MAVRHTKRCARSGETLTRHVARDPRGPREWAERKRKGPAEQTGLGPGQGEGCAAGQAAVHALTLECERCGDLVDWAQAKRRAKAARRRKVTTHDGCASASCTSGARARRAAHAKAQVGMAGALLADERVLLAWPRDVDDVDYWRRARDVTVDVANRTIDRHWAAARRE